jgi:hypothetical protein
VLKALPGPVSFRVEDVGEGVDRSMPRGYLPAVLVDSVAVAYVSFPFDIAFRAVRENRDILGWEGCPPGFEFSRSCLFVKTACRINPAASCEVGRPKSWSGDAW